MRAARASKKQEIREFFCMHLGQKFGTAFLHARFGTSFRTRVSELNRDPECPITICNETAVRSAGTQPGRALPPIVAAQVHDASETSSYWAVTRAITGVQLSLSGLEAANGK